MNAPHTPAVPHSVEAEQSFLGGLLLDNAAFDRLTSPLEPAHFFLAEHRAIYAAIRELIARQQPADMVTVYAALQAEPGTLAYLGELAANTPSAANIGRYAEIIRDRSLQRELLSATADISERVHHGTGSAVEKLDAAQSRLMSLSESSTVDVVQVGELLPDFLDRLEQIEDGSLPPRATCGYPDIDQRVHITEATDMVVIGGRPATGKTTLALNIAEARARRGEPGLIWSGEMPSSQIRDKLIASVGGVEYKAFREGRRLTSEEYDKVVYALGVIKDLPMHIFDAPGISVFDLGAKARQVKRRSGLKWIVIDYLQLMRGDGENETMRFSEISRSLKEMAKALGVTVYALSQLNRSLEARPNKRPIMSDLRSTGAIEQDADVIMFLYRDELYNPDTDAKGMAEIIVGKNRHGEAGIMVPLATRLEFSRFESMVYGQYPDLDKPQKNSRRGFQD